MGSTHNRKKQTPKCQDTEVGTTSHLGTTRSLRGKRRRESGDIGRMKRARRLNGHVRSAAKGNVMRKGGASSSERMTARGHWDLPMIDRSSENDSARALGFDDGQHKKRVTAAVDTVCGQVERMKKDELPHVTLTVQSADDGDLFTEVTVSDEARVADVLAVACRAQHKPLPRSTLSFGGDNLDAFMAEKLT